MNYGNEITSEEIKGIVGKTIVKIDGTGKYSNEIVFHFSDGKTLTFNHFQECCECVFVEDICGDVEDLVDTPLLKAYISINKPTDEQREDEFFGDLVRWTFYHFSTIKGTVTIRWYGQSNGYYGVGVDLIYKDKNGDEVFEIEGF